MCIRDRDTGRVSAGDRSAPVNELELELKKGNPVSYTHLRAHETDSYLVCRLLLEKKRRPPRSTPLYSSAASDVYKRQGYRPRLGRRSFGAGQRAGAGAEERQPCLLYTSPSPRDGLLSRMPSSA